MKCPFCDREPDHCGSPFEFKSYYHGEVEFRCEKCNEEFSDLQIAVKTDEGKEGYVSFHDIIRAIKHSILR